MKCCVIGLGRLGYKVATTLAENGMEVMAVDSNEGIINAIRDHVTQAICMRVTDEHSLRSIGVDEIDTVVVAMGENFEQSVLITALLKKKLNTQRVIARAINEIHKDILTLVGADEQILPEQEVGIRIADNLSSPFMDLVRLDKNFSISQVMAPQQCIGKKLSDINFFDDYTINCIGIKQANNIVDISPEHVILKTDKLILSGNNENLERFATQ